MTTTASSSNITPRKIRVIGVPLDLGQSRRGVDMGPSAVRVAGLILCAMAVQFLIIGMNEATHGLVRQSVATPYSSSR